jgi:hypothetical protein
MSIVQSTYLRIRRAIIVVHSLALHCKVVQQAYILGICDEFSEEVDVPGPQVS